MFLKPLAEFLLQNTRGRDDDCALEGNGVVELWGPKQSFKLFALLGDTRRRLEALGYELRMQHSVVQAVAPILQILQGHEPERRLVDSSFDV